MASKVSLEELRSQVLPSELYPRELGGCFIFLSPLLVTFWKWSNLTTSFHMGWSHQLDYVQSIHVFSLSPAPSPWFWSSDFLNCHRGRKLELWYAWNIMTSWPNLGSLILWFPCWPLVVADSPLRNTSQRDPGKLLKTPTRWRNNCNKLHKKLRLLSKHVRHSCWSSFGFVVTSKKSLDVGDRLQAMSSILTKWKLSS